MWHSILVVMLWVGFARGNSELDALLEFKKGIQEDPSGQIFGSWKPETLTESNGCPSNWHGINCDGDRVSSITLDNMALVGNITFSALLQLQMLRNLSVSNNSLTGILSPEVGSITSLEFLDLSCNSLAGSIPVQLSTLSNLVYLNLSTNDFEDVVPSVFGHLRHLRYLDLRANSFTGDLYGVLAQLQNVIHVDLSKNQFSGSIKPIENSNLTGSLQYLNISHNGLSGELFADDLVPLFDSLEVLDASHNQLNGHVPSLNVIVSLRILRLDNNQFSGSLPEALLKESSMVLTVLDLSCNRLEGPIRIITSTSLKNLNLSTNKLTGALPLRVGNCAIVDLSKNKLSGNLSVIQSWGDYVEVIDLSSNILTGSFPNETSKFLRLLSFKASNNLLEGELPIVIGTYPELKVFDLSRNQLYGQLPSSLFTSLRLTDLNLSGNSFSEPIPFPNENVPPFHSENSSLITLDLSYNSLTGRLPQEISALGGLKLLIIGRNNISGNIPREIGMLHNLLYLDLSSNNFDGSIPDDLPDGLIGLNVSYNHLSGTVPDSLMRFPYSSFYPGNSLLILPRGPPSDVPNFSGKGKHGQRMKHAVIYVVIVSAVACVALIVASALIYYRVFNGKVRAGSPDQCKSDISDIMGHRERTNPPPLSLSSSQDHSVQSMSVSKPLEHGYVSSTSREQAGADLDVSSANTGPSNHASVSVLPKHEGKSLISLIMSSPISEHLSILSVCSPDRLAGDLYLFENTFKFTAQELSCAPAESIGRSCHGTSYKATLESGRVLTVKWLREGIVKGKKEFAREARKLGNIRHPNLVSLTGYHWGPKEHEKLMISHYMDATSLMAHLCEFKQRKLQCLLLSQRLSIAVDIARALHYLHNEKAIPHGNLKSTNILLQAPKLNALLTDYSLHRLLNPAGMAEQVLNAGALGYRPPEFTSTSKPCPSLKSDVYAFGVILLELLTGKNAGEIISRDPGVVDLTDWVRLLASENRTHECFDRFIPEIDGADRLPVALDDMLRVALRCIRAASDRPEIRTVFEDLSLISL